MIRRYDGHIAQHLGDGLLVYFGYPVAHEDDAARAVRAGLEIIQALKGQGTGSGGQGERDPLQVRIGIHTGLVVIGEIGSSEKREILALGETPNIAARVQGTANPDEVIISATTYRLVEGLFEAEERGQPELKGIVTPLTLYRVIEEGEAHSRFEVAISTGLTPLVGREEELRLLQQHWEHAKNGEGKVVFLSGEPGIGKSRLVQEFKEQLGREGGTRLEFRCSPYYQNSALYPIIEHMQRFLRFQREDTAQAKLAKLRQALSQYHFPQADTLPLLAALLSLPLTEETSRLTLSPQKQKEKTLALLMAWIAEESENTAVFCVWDDLQWADPSTLELLTLCLEQISISRIFAVLTYRPDFSPPWRLGSRHTRIILNRLGPPQIRAMVEKVTRGKTCPVEVLQQIVTKTDGVPLFVEELTKMVLESGLLKVVDGHYELTGVLPPLAIPSTLQDSLMARLDRLAAVREIAQLGAVLGREFSYELIHAVSPSEESLLQQGLQQLVEAELIYQRELPPRSTYVFKHALVQETAYQSLLKSRRQQYHQQIAQVMTKRFPEMIKTQPEMLAHHYTEAGLLANAIPHWQQAGQRALQRSANLEAVGHLTKGLELLNSLLDTPERVQHELSLQITLGMALTATKGYAVPEVGTVYTRARDLCRQLGKAPQLLPVLFGLWRFYLQRGELQTACDIGEECLRLAQQLRDPASLLRAHNTVGVTLYYLGELRAAQKHLEDGIALYSPEKQRSLAAVQDPMVACLSYMGWLLWLLGYPDQALKRSDEACTLAQALSHPYSLAQALFFSGGLHHLRQEVAAARRCAEAVVTLSAEQGFPFWWAQGTSLLGWGLVKQGQRREEGITQLRQGLATYQSTGADLGLPYYATELAEAYGLVGQVEEGLRVLAAALETMDKTGDRWSEAEIYRLKGELTLAQSSAQDHEREAEACFLRAIDVAHGQYAKSWELRSATSLARLWRQQGKKTEAHQLLSEVYNRFTEGFDTKDLQEAKALLEELA